MRIDVVDSMGDVIVSQEVDHKSATFIMEYLWSLEDVEN